MTLIHCNCEINGNQLENESSDLAVECSQVNRNSFVILIFASLNQIKLLGWQKSLGKPHSFSSPPQSRHELIELLSFAWVCRSSCADCA
jgi:hypothetical protein